MISFEKIRGQKGFTLVELLIAMVVASIVMASIYAVYRSQTAAHRTQQLVVQMQQNIRAALYLLEREIRMAGYSITDPPAAAGFVQDLMSLGSPHDGSGAATDANNQLFVAGRAGTGNQLTDTVRSTVEGILLTAGQQRQAACPSHFDDGGFTVPQSAPLR